MQTLVLGLATEASRLQISKPLQSTNKSQDRPQKESINHHGVQFEMSFRFYPCATV